MQAIAVDIAIEKPTSEKDGRGGEERKSGRRSKASGEHGGTGHERKHHKQADAHARGGPQATRPKNVQRFRGDIAFIANPMSGRYPKEIQQLMV